MHEVDHSLVDNLLRYMPLADILVVARRIHSPAIIFKEHVETQKPVDPIQDFLRNKFSIQSLALCKHGQRKFSSTLSWQSCMLIML